MQFTLKTLWRWGEMIKFSHSVFAMPFALIATFLAARSAFIVGHSPHIYPGPIELLLIVACMVTARSVAMTFNRIIDASIDAKNPRTASRPIPAGTISKNQALAFLIAAAAAFIIACAGFWWLIANIIPVALSVPVLAYLCFYSYTKRFTRYSHFVLGTAIAFSPVAAWLAIHPPSVGWPAVVLMAAVTLWIAGFDIIYACQDIQVDREQGLFSLPSRLGPARALLLARLAHVGTVCLLAAMMPLASLGWLYGLGVGMVAGLLIVEHSIIKPTDLSRVNIAFFTINGAISLLLGALAIIDCLLQLASAVQYPT